jgi:transposase
VPKSVNGLTRFTRAMSPRALERFARLLIGRDTPCMRAYSMDLRERVLAAVDRGTPRKEIVRTLGISEPTIRRYLRLRRETGSVAPKPPPKRPFSIGQSVEHRRALWKQLEEHYDATLEKHCRLCGRESEGLRSLSPLCLGRSAGWVGRSKKECGCLRRKRRREKCLAR